MNSIYDYSYTKTNGETIALETFKGKKILIVNTATACGLKNQFKDLEQLHKDFEDLVVIGFPSNQFKDQEPIDNDNLVSTCQINFGVTFDLSQKIDVNGDDADPLFKYLTSNYGGKIKWNFTKFLFDEQGQLIKRYAPITKPTKIKKYLK